MCVGGGGVQVYGRVSVCGVVVKERRPGCVSVCTGKNSAMDTKFNALTVNCFCFKSDSFWFNPFLQVYCFKISIS